MRLGLYIDLRNPPPWRRPRAAHYARWLELIEDADGLGVGAIWLAEHHGFDDGYLPQPLSIAAALAARTRRARIGTAVLIGPVRHPRLIAEEAGAADLISGGRIELGIGAGNRAAEYEMFGVDFGERMARTRGRLRELQALLADDALSPPTIQRPIPLWAGFRGPRGAQFAGELGIGLLDATPETCAVYCAALTGSGHHPQSARVAHPAHFLLAADPELAWRRVAPHYEYMWRSYLPSGLDANGVALDHRRWTAPGARGTEIALPGRTARFEVLTSTEAERRIRTEFAEMPLTDVFCWASIAGMDDDLVEEHVTLLAGDLTTRLADFKPRPSAFA